MDYPHFDTSSGERKTATAKFNRPKISMELASLRESAFKRSIPTADDETLSFLITEITSLKPQKILELGTAIGISGIAMLSAETNAHLTTIEKSKDFYFEAMQNFEKSGVSNRVTAYEGDIDEVLNQLKGEYDFIFMDCAKAQYIKYLPKLKSLLRRGGVLLADDVLLFGWVTGEEEIPQKRHMLARHMIEYVDAVTTDCELQTTILNIGDGISLSVKL